MINTDTHSLVLRTCNEDMTSYNNFKWPESGVVECSDWIPNKKCGNGLHGWLYGHGSILSNTEVKPNSKWLVVSVETNSIIDLDGKVKFPKGEVVFCGSKEDATNFLILHDSRANNQGVIGHIKIDKEFVYRKVITTGDLGTSISGDGCRSISGILGNSKSGYGGISISGILGKSESGTYSRAISGDYGTSISDEGGYSESGYFGTSISGDGGTAFSGEYGVSIAGKFGTAVCGVGGKCKVGEGGIINIDISNKYGDIKAASTRSIEGQYKIEADTFYKLDENNNFVKCD